VGLTTADHFHLKVGISLADRLGNLLSLGALDILFASSLPQYFQENSQLARKA